MNFEFYNEMKFKYSFYKNLNNDCTRKVSGSPNPIKSNHYNVYFCI